MATVRGFEFTGLRELNAYLKKIGVTDDAIKTAMHESGQIVAQEAWRIMPTVSGAMAKSLKVNRSKSVLSIKVGNNTTVPYAYNFHALALGASNPPGYFTFDVPTHTRKGHTVRAYSVVRRLRNFPFLFIAWERKATDLFNNYVTAIDRLIKGA